MRAVKEGAGQRAIGPPTPGQEVEGRHVGRAKDAADEGEEVALDGRVEDLAEAVDELEDVAPRAVVVEDVDESRPLVLVEVRVQRLL